MGHVRTGPLPATRKWNQIVELIAGGASAAQIAVGTLNAAEKGLKNAAADPGVVETVWQLVRLPLAARDTNFPAALRRCGVEAGDAPGLLDVAVGFSDAVDARLPNGKGRTDLGEMAQTAGVETLNAVVGPRLRQLFGTAPEDVKAAFAALATVKHFGTLAAHFFARFVGKCLNYFLSKTLPDHVGDGGRFHTSAEYGRFIVALDTHCREASKIVETYAGEWFSKHNWQAAGDITVHNRRIA